MKQYNLAEKNLITIQNRLGRQLYELAHDRLIRPIKDSNMKHKQSIRRINLLYKMESWQNKNYSDIGAEKLSKGKLDSEIKSKSEKKPSIEVTEVVKKLDQLKEELRSIIEIESERSLPFDNEKSLIEDSLRFASLLYYNGNYEESIKYLDNIIHRDPNDINAWVNKGFALNALKRYDEAISTFQKALELDSYFYVWNGLGIVYTTKQKYEEALQCYDKALKLDPKYTDAWYNKGQVYDYLQKYEEALQCYDEILELDPKYKDAWNSKGNAYKNLQRYPEGSTVL